MWYLWLIYQQENVETNGIIHLKLLKLMERVGGKTKREALEKGIQALNEYNNSGQHFEPSNVSVADFLDYYQDNYARLNNAYNTLCRNVSAIEVHLKPAFGQYRLATLGTATIQEYVNEKLIQGAAKSTVENFIAPLSQAFEYAINLGYVRDNPCKRVKYAKAYDKEKGREIITIEQYNTIMEELKDKPHFSIAIMIGWYAGLRISETFGLTWDNIDFENKTITVDHQIVKRNFGVDVRKAYKVKGKKQERSSWYFAPPKTKQSNRTIKVSDELINALKSFRKKQLENHIYYGEYISTDSFKYPSRIIHHKLGIETFDYHSLRHTHATMLIEAGASPKSVQMRLGHSSIKTTYGRYVHDTDEMKQNIVDVFDKAMKRKQG